MNQLLPPENKMIAVFVPGLPDVPGWLYLSPEKQDALLQLTSDVKQFDAMSALGEFGKLMRLTEVARLLDGEEMRMRDYLRLLYPTSEERTLARKQQMFADMAATIPLPILKETLTLGEEVMRQFDRIASAPLGEIRNALREMPLLPVNTEHSAEAYMATLNSKIIEARKERRQKGRGEEEPDFPERSAMKAVLHYLRSAGLKTSAQKRQFLQRVVGWVMESEAVSGTLRCGRVSVPEGYAPRGRGRPRKEVAA